MKESAETLLPELVFSYLRCEKSASLRSFHTFQTPFHEQQEKHENRCLTQIARASVARLSANAGKGSWLPIHSSPPTCASRQPQCSRSMTASAMASWMAGGGKGKIDRSSTIR